METKRRDEKEKRRPRGGKEGSSTDVVQTKQKAKRGTTISALKHHIRKDKPNMRTRVEKSFKNPRNMLGKKMGPEKSKTKICTRLKNCVKSRGGSIVEKRARPRKKKKQSKKTHHRPMTKNRTLYGTSCRDTK